MGSFVATNRHSVLGIGNMQWEKSEMAPNVLSQPPKGWPERGPQLFVALLLRILLYADFSLPHKAECSLKNERNHTAQ